MDNRKNSFFFSLSLFFFQQWTKIEGVSCVALCEHFVADGKGAEEGDTHLLCFFFLKVPTASNAPFVTSISCLLLLLLSSSCSKFLGRTLQLKEVLQVAMAGVVVSATAAPWVGRCFPIVSFLHVPGKMSTPLWLMIGTAFPFQAQLDGQPLAAGAPQLLLTAKHTFAPWDYAKDASQLKIPQDYRKLRYVVGRMYRPSSEGQAVAADRVGLRLLSQHPTLDVAVLAVEGAGREATPTSAPPVVFDAPLTLSTSRLPAASPGLILGYRGVGRLGEMDTLDASLLQRLPPAERDALLKELQDVEGKQVRAQTTVSILDEKGMCKGVGDQDRCFHGMSGGPLLTASGACAGVLYGHHPDAPGCLGYTPCAEFADWLAGVVQRVSHQVEKS